MGLISGGKPPEVGHNNGANMALAVALPAYRYATG